ncbi:MAG: hypothetical protein R3272_14610 [Candidatus Promineifilaceae bacterium]|nr:hypothetical protein [Candidatus Promineifilaceae bacterium]
MIVVMSDLHLVDGTASGHTLSAPTREAFLADVVALARQTGATEVRLLLLGDIVDLIRTQQWLEEAPEDRPWGAHGLRDVAGPAPGSRTAARCLDILGCFPADGRRESVAQPSILRHNWETFAFFRNFPETIRERLGRELPVEVIYVIGNHDRLCNLYPAVRDELQRVLGLEVDEETTITVPSGEWVYPYHYVDEAHGLFARHGHQFDPFSFEGPEFDHAAHMEPSVSDVISAEIVVRIPHTLASLQPHHPAVEDRLIENLKDVDDVRPFGSAVDWFHYRVDKEDNRAVRRALEETFDRVLSDFLSLPFVREWEHPRMELDEVVRAVTHPRLQPLVDRVIDVTNSDWLLRILLPNIDKFAYHGGGSDKYTEAAYEEAIWRNNPAIHFIVYGHTHRAMVQPLSASSGDQVVYLNTGTWRNQIFRTLPADQSQAPFVKLKQMTYVFLYNEQENRRRVGVKGPGFDVRTTHSYEP